MTSDPIALALVTAMADGNDDNAARLISGLTVPELVDVAVVLADTLGVAWRELCEHDGVDFQELLHATGLWLAESETQ